MLANIEKIQEMLDCYNLDALIITNRDSMKYLGYDMWFDSVKEWMTIAGGSNDSGSTSMCVIPNKGEPIYIISAFALSFITSEYRNVFPYGRYTNYDIPGKSVSGENKIPEVLRGCVYEDPYDALNGAIEDLGIKRSRIALEYDGMNRRHTNEVKNTLNGCVLFNGSELIRIARLYKTPKEIELIKKCFEITEMGIYRSLNNIAKGTNLGEANDEFENYIRSQGALHQHYSLMHDGLGMTENRDNVFNNKMIMGVDAGVIYKNYISDTGLTIFLGQYNNKDLDTYKRLLSIIESGFSYMRPGKKCLDIYKAMKACSDKIGNINVMFEGHGIGLSFREYPYINSGVDYSYYNGFNDISANFTIEESMVINLELGLHEFGKKTFQIEKTILVTKNGMQPIIQQDRVMPIIIN